MKHSREKEEAEVEGVSSLYETFNILDSRFNEKKRRISWISSDRRSRRMRSLNTERVIGNRRYDT